MSVRRIRTEEVIVFLGVEGPSWLDQLRAEGLFEEDELDLEQAEELRLAGVLMGEMGVNPAGVQVALHLRRRLLALEARARTLAEVIRSRS